MTYPGWLHSSSATTVNSAPSRPAGQDRSGTRRAGRGAEAFNDHGCLHNLPGPPAPASTPNLPVNIDYVFGFSDAAPQHWMPPLAYLAALLALMPLVIFLPTHLALKKLMRPAPMR